ncbi:MAG: exodeoxyribonuclease III [Alphaproteobacteria bacterium]|nr:exodeoxyribonuclease III [Alphaproteobacteria bacterium]
MSLAVATWNINSVRLRLDLVRCFLKEVAPDVLCLQEIKAEEHQFPFLELRAAGYPHIAVAGFKGYNGVALISKLPLKKVERRAMCGQNDGRHIAADLPGGIRLHNFYVPAGGDEPDPKANPKFDHKLRFVADMTAWLNAAHSRRQKLILVGDLNIAPEEHDVWSHTQLLDVVSHTPVEVEGLGRLRAGLDWIDVGRHFTPADRKLYSWWSYRARDWEATDRGRRLDHVWVTPPLGARLAGIEHLKAWRGREQPSDHVPVVARLGTPR